MNEPSLRSRIGGRQSLFAIKRVAALVAALLLSITTAERLIAADWNNTDDSIAEPCVLLKNGNVLFGSATRLGTMLSIARADQSKISLPFDQVEAIGRSISDLHAHRIRLRYPSDLRRIQSDVRWCLRYGLIREAATDALAARALDPANAETIQLLRQIASRIKQEQPSSAPQSETSESAIRQVSHQIPVTESVPASPDPPALNLSDANVHSFAAKIQPILMNRCAGCHARDESNTTGFQLHSALTSKWAPRIVVGENLKSVMPYIDFDSPHNSTLRARAFDGHGGRRHSFGSENSSMMNNLDYWLSQLTLQDSLTPWESAINEGGTGKLVAAQPPALSRIDNVSAAETVPSDAHGIGETTNIAAQQSASASEWQDPSTSTTNETLRIRRMPKVANPFDPELFNRRFLDH